MKQNSKALIKFVPICLERVSDYLVWFNDEQIRKFLAPTTPKTTKAIVKWIQQMLASDKFSYFSIFVPKGNKYIGHVGLKSINLAKKQAEVGIVIGEKEYWRKGIGMLAFQKLLQKVKKLCLKKIFAKINKGNTASIKFFLELGFGKSTKEEKGSVILVYHL